MIKVNKNQYGFLYGEDFKKDLDTKGYATIAMRDSDTGNIFVGDVNKDVLVRGEKWLAIKWFGEGEAYKYMIANEAKELGKKGGEATLKKYGKEKMTEWGKKGGRPSGKKVNAQTA